MRNIALLAALLVWTATVQAGTSYLDAVRLGPRGSAPTGTVYLLKGSLYSNDITPSVLYFHDGTTWQQVPAGIVVSGTTNRVAKFTGANAVGNARLSDTGSGQIQLIGAGLDPDTDLLYSLGGLTKRWLDMHLHGQVGTTVYNAADGGLFGNFGLPAGTVFGISKTGQKLLEFDVLTNRAAFPVSQLSIGTYASAASTRLDVVDSGTPLAVSGAVARVVNSGSASNNAMVSVQSGDSGQAGVVFGDDADARGSVFYVNSAISPTSEYLGFSSQNAERLKLDNQGLAPSSDSGLSLGRSTLRWRSLRLFPSTAPGGPSEGLIYALSADNHPYYYNGTAHKKILLDGDTSIATGTLNQIAKFTPDGANLGNSNFYDNGTAASVAVPLAVGAAVTPTHKLDVISSGTTDAVTDTVLAAVNSGSAGLDAAMSIQSGGTGSAYLKFGDNVDGGRGSIQYANQSGDAGEFFQMIARSPTGSRAWRWHGVTGAFYPTTDGEQDLGGPSNKFGAGYLTSLYLAPTGSAPASAEGWIYWNDTANRPQIYDTGSATFKNVLVSGDGGTGDVGANTTRTDNYLTKWTNAATKEIGNSSIQDNGGLVSVGTDAGTRPLNVLRGGAAIAAILVRQTGTGAADVEIERVSDTQQALLDFTNTGSGVGFSLGMDGDATDNFYIGNDGFASKYLTILPGGNVGIGGTPAVDVKLDVLGVGADVVVRTKAPAGFSAVSVLDRGDTSGRAAVLYDTAGTPQVAAGISGTTPTYKVGSPDLSTTWLSVNPSTGNVAVGGDAADPNITMDIRGYSGAAGVLRVKTPTANTAAKILVDRFSNNDTQSTVVYQTNGTDNVWAGISGTTPTYKIGTPSFSDILFSVNPSTGNVAIGADASDPNVDLDVTNGLGDQVLRIRCGDGGYSAAQILEFPGSAASMGLVLFKKTGLTEIWTGASGPTPTYKIGDIGFNTVCFAANPATGNVAVGGDADQSTVKFDVRGSSAGTILQRLQNTGAGHARFTLATVSGVGNGRPFVSFDRAGDIASDWSIGLGSDANPHFRISNMLDPASLTRTFAELEIDGITGEVRLENQLRIPHTAGGPQSQEGALKVNSSTDRLNYYAGAAVHVVPDMSDVPAKTVTLMPTSEVTQVALGTSAIGDVSFLDKWAEAGGVKQTRLNFILPKNRATGTAVLWIHLAPGAGTGTGLALSTNYNTLAHGIDHVGANTTLGTSYTPYVIAASTATDFSINITIASGATEYVNILLARDPGNANDTFTGDIYLRGTYLEVPIVGQ